MRQLEVENKLRDVVSRIILQVDLATAQGRTDINLALEDALIPVLKAVYNLPNLVNLNRKQRNYPGIDLGDDHDRVAFQVTSTTSLDKVKFTVRQFMERSYFNSFNELYILMLSKKQSSYSQVSVNELLTGDFTFSCKEHIIDLADVLRLVTALRLPAQERVLANFQRILGEVDAFVSLRSDSVATPTATTSNLQHVRLPVAVYVADLAIDDAAVIARARKTLSYKRKARSRRSVVKMALLLNGVETDAWACHGDRLFSFHDLGRCGLISVVDEGTVERLDVSDLADSGEVDNLNVLKQLLAAETRERLKARHVRMDPKDGFFFFVASEEGRKERKETWVGKRNATRRVHEVVHQTKDPTKVAHHQHLSFELTFATLGGSWYAQIVPSWYYSFDGRQRSNRHDKLLAQQKRLERNSSVRNIVRFVSFFLANLAGEGDDDDGLRFESLLRFDVRADDEGEDEVVDDLDGADVSQGEAA